MKVASLSCLVFTLCAAARVFAAAPTDHPVIALWPNGAPGSEARKDEPEKLQGDRLSNIHHPSLTVYLPAKDTATGAAVIVAPGGGHRFLTIRNEGTDVAQWLADHGIAAFVLKHRLGNDEANPAGTPQPYKWDVHGVADGQRAMKIVRSRAAEWNVNPKAIGMMGFSAGGEIVAQVMMHPEEARADAPDPLDRVSSRPDFQALIYPGKSPLIIPTKESPPAFMACGFNDRQDISEGLPKVYLLFKQAGVQADLHVYSGVNHGFGIRETLKPGAKSALAGWPDRFREFLAQQKFLNSPSG
jgi:acetyl esterase/lipase